MRSIFQGTGPRDHHDTIPDPDADQGRNNPTCDVRPKICREPGQADRISFRTSTGARKEAGTEAGEDPETGGLMKAC